MVATPSVRETDKRVLQSRAAMRQALISLLGRYAFADISAAMVVAHAGVGYATFFRHYADTEALLLEISDAMIGEVSAAMTPALEAGDEAGAMLVAAQYVADNRATAYAMLVTAGPATQGAMIKRARAQFGADPRRPTSRGIPRELAIRITVGGMISILAWWLESAPNESPSVVAALLVRLVAEPVAGASASFQDA
jgi:AcrR family transcriptional regulator